MSKQKRHVFTAECTNCDSTILLFALHDDYLKAAGVRIEHRGGVGVLRYQCLVFCGGCTEHLQLEPGQHTDQCVGRHRHRL